MSAVTSIRCGTLTLADVVQQYCLHQFQDRPKHFNKYLVMAGIVWNDLLKRTLWTFNAQ